MVAHDGGSYYARQDIPAGVEPPGGEWMMLGGGGITDAAELTGALTQFVDASGAVVDLDGEGPELQAITLAEILSVLYQSLDSSVEASRVTGALTDQVDLSSGVLDISEFGLGSNYPTHMPLDRWFMVFATMLSESFADRQHKHPVSDFNMTGTPSASTFARGDGVWAVPPNTTYSVPTQAEAEAGTATTGRAFSALRVRQAANAAIAAREWFGTQAQYDALATKDDPNVTYNILEG